MERIDFKWSSSPLPQSSCRGAALGVSDDRIRDSDGTAAATEQDNDHQRLNRKLDAALAVARGVGHPHDAYGDVTVLLGRMHLGMGRHWRQSTGAVDRRQSTSNHPPPRIYHRSADCGVVRRLRRGSSISPAAVVAARRDRNTATEGHKLDTAEHAGRPARQQGETPRL